MSGRLMATAEEAVGGAFHLFWGGSLATVLSAVCAILIARLLEPELYGIYSLALIVSGFLTIFTDYGVSQALTRFIALYRSRGEQGRIIPLLRAGLSFSLTTSLTMLLIGFIFADKLTSLLISRPEMVQLVRITLILVLIQPLTTAAGCTLLGFGDMKDYAIIDVARQLVRTVVSPLLIVLGFSVLGAVAGYVIASTVGFIISLTLVYRRYRQVKRSSLNPATASGREALASMIAYGLPLYLSNTLSGFTATLRGVILAYFTTNFLIGNFNTAMNFTVLITLISSPIATALFPAFSKLESNGGETKTMFTYSVKYTSALIIPAAVFISTMSRDLIFLLYGEGYSHAPLYLALYTVNFLFAGIGSTVLGSFFSGVGDSKVNLRATLLYVCLFTPSAIALTSTLQVEGLLIATITATAASTLYSLRIAAHKYGLRVDIKSSAKIYLASLLAAAPIIPITLYSPLPRIANLAAGAILYLTVYLTATPLLKILTREDIETLTRIFTKVAVLRPITRIISNYEVKVMNLIEAGLKSHKAFYR
jgi:O-antigen/teichoic acid export membrane protein